MSLDYWAKLIALPRPSKVVDFPRKNEDGSAVELAIWVLSQDEQMACSSAADALAKKLLKDAVKNDERSRGYDDIYQNAAAVEILFRVCRQKEDLAKPFFPAPDAIRKHLTTDEIALLFTHYLSVQVELGPIVADMTSDEVDAIVKRLVESGSRFPLDGLSPEALKTLVLSMASRLSTFLTGISLLGTPPEVITATASE